MRKRASTSEVVDVKHQTAKRNTVSAMKGMFHAQPSASALTARMIKHVVIIPSSLRIQLQLR